MKALNCQDLSLPWKLPLVKVTAGVEAHTLELQEIRVLAYQNVYYTSSQQIQVGILSPTVDDDDNRCLVDVNSRPRLIECSYAKAKRLKLHWQFSQPYLLLP
ncbi:hypothetical protein J1605_014246 [Eschrichtius robustus]|uniref:Uncharacterized protein n=1 Tax=Eschrichtius robustus TaxID=9764 RepID=A0AB34GEQ1_ESCRO|nr:hypothetical protein J1605_014246 [Eschrichtius robustus]